MAWYTTPDLNRKKTPIEIARNHFIEKMDEPTKKLFGQATFALFEGACHDDDFPGYSKAVEILKEWSENNITEVWVTEDDDVFDYDPETRHEGAMSLSIAHIGLAEARSAVFHELF